MAELERLKALARGKLESCRTELIELSLRIHANPELGFQERQAAAWLTGWLEEKGFRVERRLCGFETAFRATHGKGSPVIAFMAEYDALPEIGHGCGHNIIAASALGAALAAKVGADQLEGTLQVIGTPAEELYGGKALLAEKGAFTGIDAAMMVHPGSRNAAVVQTLACATLQVEFWGRAAHAAAHPEDGINALEAMVLAINSINSLRQHLQEKARVHGIITDGGEAPNIVPAHSAGTFLVRASDEAYLEELKGKVLNCFAAASLATGARLEHHWEEVSYRPMRSNRIMAGLFQRNLESLGCKVEPPGPQSGFGSTDMGNISHILPSIHPSIAIAPPGASSHTLEFASAASSEAGHLGLLNGAKALAMTALDLMHSPEAMRKAQQEFLHGDD